MNIRLECQRHLYCFDIPERRTRRSRVLLSGFRRPEGRLHPFYLKCSGEVNSPCAKVGSVKSFAQIGLQAVAGSVKSFAQIGLQAVA